MAELSLLAKATLVLAAALIASRLARRAPAAVRALLLASAFGVLLILPLATFALPPRTVQVPLPAASESMLWVEPISIDVAASITPDSTTAGGRTNRFAAPSLAAILRVGWAVGALLFVAPLVVALMRLRRLRRCGVRSVEVGTLATVIARETGVARGVEVFVHADLPAPMTCGVLRPAIGLPVDAPAWTEEELRHAIVHELEHVRRGDWPIHLLARVTCALYWFHPLAWSAWRQLCLESERACDDAVLRNAGQTAYAEQLVSLARRLSKRSPAPLLSMAGRSNLATRISAVLDPDQARGHAGSVSAAVILVAALALTVAISPLQATTTPEDAVPQARTDSSALSFEVASVRPNTPDDSVRVND
jgi:beta-lactamase regulating signal transducer with metallopeptidase domain